MRNRVWATLAAAGVLAAVAVAPAQATVVEKGRFSEFDFEPYRFAYDCGFRVEVVGRASGVFRLREGKNASDSAYFSLDRISFREVHTNPETGEWFSVRGHSLFNEVRARRVEGSVFEFRNIEAGQPFVLEDSDGNLVLRDRGVVRQTILFDTGGDDRPGGTFIEVLDISIGGPHPRFTGDLCEIAAPLIGS